MLILVYSELYSFFVAAASKSLFDLELRVGICKKTNKKKTTFVAILLHILLHKLGQIDTGQFNTATASFPQIGGGSALEE